jgi:predicted site-specific integrase-resolvase
MTIFGYARVSTDGQTLDAQVAALKRAGAARVFHEKVSGAKTARRELARLLVITGCTLEGWPYREDGQEKQGTSR